MKSLLPVLFLMVLLLSLAGPLAQSFITAHVPLQGSGLAGRNAGAVSYASKVVNQTGNALVSNCESRSGNAEVESAMDPTNGYIYDLWIGCNGIGFALSTDGGAVFNTPLVFPGSLDIPGNSSSWDPAITVSNSGVIYASYMFSENNLGGAPYVAISYDHGATFEPGVNVSTPGEAEFSDRDFIAVSSNNTIYVTWDYSPNASLVNIVCPPGGSCYYTTGDLNIVISHSNNGGKTWSKFVPISPDYPNGGGVSAPLVVEPNGRIDVLYEDYAIGVNHTLGPGLNYFTYSTDGGSTWSSRTAVGNSSGHLSNTEWWIDGDLSRDGSGTLYASFDTPNGTSENAWLTISNDDGLSWSSPVELSRGDNSTFNIMPGVLGAANSSVYTAWMARYPSGWSAYFQVYSKTGQPISKQIVVSNRSGALGIWGGDTLGLASLDGGVGISWGYGVQSVSRQNVSEIFSSIVYNVTLSSNGAGSTNPSGSVWFRAGSVVSIQAIPGSSSIFAGWNASSQSLEISNSSLPGTSLSVSGGGLIVAKFVPLAASTATSGSATTTTILGSGFAYSPYDILMAVIGAIIIIAGLAVIFRRRSLLKKQNRGF